MKKDTSNSQVGCVRECVCFTSCVLRCACIYMFQFILLADVHIIICVCVCVCVCARCRLWPEQGGRRPWEQGVLVLRDGGVHGPWGGQQERTHAQRWLVVLRRAHGEKGARLVVAACQSDYRTFIGRQLNLRENSARVVKNGILIVCFSLFVLHKNGG